MAATVQQILQNKGGSTYSVAPESTVLQALQLMADKNVSAVLVMEGQRLVGIFTERDYARKVELQGRSADTTRLGDIMTADVLFVTPANTAQDCMALMTDKHLRHLPVMEAGKLVGLISIGDLVKDIISEQQYLIAQLESYIRS